MTNLFRASNWVSESQDSIVSRGVTTCAGMRAHTVILAQTRVGFLTGGRKKSFLALPEDEQMVQLEEAYARATVAITRARELDSSPNGCLHEIQGGRSSPAPSWEGNLKKGLKGP